MHKRAPIPLSSIVQHVRQAPAWFWFRLALLLVIVFCGYTAIVTTGALDASSTQVEQWLLARPITRADCLMVEWRNIGNPLPIFVLTVLVGFACLLLGYRWPALVYLVLLLFVCLFCEVLGKGIFTQAIPRPISYGMGSLGCPQMDGQPTSVHLEALLGLWWKLPAPSPQLIDHVHQLGQRPFAFGGTVLYRSYPGGHAMRTSFLGVLVAWLCWRHIKSPAARIPVTVVVLVLWLSIGWMQFYIGAHLLTDTIAGYLLGIGAACCAIGLLMLHAPRPRTKPSPGISP